jgi:Concanavalin A-like lectin/glucanases superfamily/Carboxypeptidase regulatory-like domain
LEFIPPNSLQFIVTDNASRNDLIIPTSLVTGTWYHIAAIRQGNTNLFYLNGSLIGQQTAGSNLNTGTGGTAYIGKLPVPATNLRNLSGKIDELSVYNRALTQGEITSIFNAGQAGKLKTANTPTGFADLGLGSADSGFEKTNPQSEIQNPQSVTTTIGDVNVTFQSVSVGGVTQEVPLDPSLLPPLPNVVTFAGLIYDVATSAVYSGNVDLCFNLTALTALNFNNLRVYHLESGAWVNRTAPANTFPTLCTSGVTSLSPFAIANFTPTAANVSVSGKITDSSGNGIARVRVSITGANGATRAATTNSFGFYRFDEILAGETYVISAASKRYQFSQPTQIILVNDALDGIDFTAIE